MTEPTFGFSITPDDNEARASAPADMSTVAIIGTAPAADADVYPFLTRVLITSDDTQMVQALGAGGTLADAVAGVDAQLGAISAKIIIVRVAVGVDADATMTNIIAGLQLLREPSDLGVSPRLIIAPGFTGQTKNGVVSIPVTAEGSGYTAATVSFSGGAGAGAAATAVIEGGKIKAVNITNAGAYTAAPTATLNGTGGNGATLGPVALGMLANPVVAAMGAVLEDLKAHAFVGGPDTTSAASKAWRGTINHRRITPLEIGYKVQQGGSVVSVPPEPRAVGLQVAADAEAGGVPSKSIANRPVQGIVGLTRNVRFSLLDGSTDGQDLLAHNIGVTVRGERSDGAIADSGFIIIATDNAGDDPLWQFYHQVRMRDYIHLGFTRFLRKYLGKYALTSQTVQAVLNSMTAFLGELQAGGHIIGFKVGFNADENDPANLRLGKFNVFFQAEEAPLLRKLGIRSGRYAEALDDLLASIAA